MLRSLFLIPLLVAATSAQIVAPQPVSFTGRVELVPDPAAGLICAPPEYRLRCSDGTFFVQSQSIDLGALIGQNRTFVATQVSPLCPLYEITGVQPAVAELTLCGTPGLGCPIRLHSQPGGLSAHALFVSLAPGFVPVSLGKGSYLLGEPSLLVAMASGNFPPEGATFDFVLPSDPVIVAVPIYWQAASRPIGPVGPLKLSNADCITAVGLTLFCIDPASCF